METPRSAANARMAPVGHRRRGGRLCHPAQCAEATERCGAKEPLSGAARNSCMPDNCSRAAAAEMRRGSARATTRTLGESMATYCMGR